MYNRVTRLPKFPKISFFLWGSKTDREKRMIEMSYWRLSSGVEVDFILGDMKVAVEAKATSNAHQDHVKGLRELKKEYPEVKRRILVCMEDVSRKTEDGIEILNYRDFATRLWHGRIL